MKVIMVMFDSLNRHHLPAYGCDWTHAPNFRRLAARTATFEQSYVCSMPCMPARRDFHTGRPNFLHRSWGPVEPFDDSVPAILRDRGVHTHLVSDHYHYWEEGGATYHTKYNTWEFFRGQEGDPWVGQVRVPPAVNAFGRNAEGGMMHQQDRVNRRYIREEQEFPQARTFAAGLEYIRRNAADDNWFLQLETFDPHEPFFSHRQYKDHFAKHYDQWRAKNGPLWDWPPYAGVTESPEMVEHMRMEYASLLAMCDAKLGNVLDLMDELNLWDDTMLVVWTDHGFMLGEHECWAKMWMGFYEEVAHTPFFVWDPRSRQAGVRRRALVQPSIDLGPTLLRYFGVDLTPDMRGFDLAAAIADDRPVREAAMFGLFGGHVNVTDGRYTYWRGPVEGNQPLNEYTVMPTHMRQSFSPAELARDKVSLAEPLAFTKGCPTLRIAVGGGSGFARRALDTRLYDLHADPQQTSPIKDAAVEQRMIRLLVEQMKRCDAPAEQFTRLGLPA